MLLTIQNNVQLTGNITRDLELKLTEKSSYLRFIIAILSTTGGTNYIPCLAFNEIAEYISHNYSKGVNITVTGRLQSSSYTDKSGVKRYGLDVIIEDLTPSNQKAQENDSLPF